jgi:hypothetical protein
MQTILDRANRDPQFRSRLDADPAAAFKEAGVELPEGARFEVVDCRSGDIHIVLGARSNVPELDRLIELAEKDSVFKESLLRDPRSAVESHVGQKLPSGCAIHVREADPNAVYLFRVGSPDSAGALSDDELEAVSGGIAPLLLMGIGAAAGAGGAVAGVAIGLILGRKLGYI